MQRRTLILGGTALGAAAFTGFLPAKAQVLAQKTFDFKGTDFLSGGTANVPANLAAPVFRATPNCTTTACKTIGPCYMENAVERYDLTEGQTGLPTRVSFRLVDAATCEPIADARVEIWHTSNMGIYTGADVNDMCTLDNAEMEALTAFRGWAITDADGRVDFLTTYPGWYSSRAPHIHMRIVVGEEELLISQLLFDDALSDIIYDQHPDYVGRSDRPVRNTNDTVFDDDEVEAHIFDVEKIDGVLQASFTIGFDRGGECSEPAGGPIGGPPPGGMPPDGAPPRPVE